jgi:AAA family ATP:ADP antiporter
MKKDTLGVALLTRRVAALRDAIFPIYGRREIARFASLAGVYFCVILVIVTTREQKDALIVAECGAEAVAFLKLYAVLPAATLYLGWYNFLSSALHGRPRALYYATALPFFAFFALFAAVLYPARAALHPAADAPPPAAVALLLRLGGRGFASVEALWRRWLYAVYFVAAEARSGLLLSCGLYLRYIRN